MLTISLAIMLGAIEPGGVGLSAPAIGVTETGAQRGLKDDLKAKLKDMSDADHAIFHDDVTSLVVPYFPKGQSFAEAERVLREQALGPLRQFHGKGNDTSSTIYVSHSDLVSASFSDVYVVLDFEFDGTAERDMTLKSVSAFLQASSM